MSSIHQNSGANAGAGGSSSECEGEEQEEPSSSSLHEGGEAAVEGNLNDQEQVSYGLKKMV